MTGLVQDLRYALRQLRKSPGFTCTVVLTLALGISASVVVFSVVEAALLRSWPAKEPQRIVQIMAKTPQGVDGTFSYADYRVLAEPSKSLEGILAYSRHSEFLRVGADTFLTLEDEVSPNYFSVLGIGPQFGRTFQGGPYASGPRVIISDRLWRRFFHADPALVGKQIWLTDRSYTVIGIAPPRFRGLAKGVFTDLWVPLIDKHPEQVTERGLNDYFLLGRLRPGVTAEQAQVELSFIARQLAQAYPAVDRARDVFLISEQTRLRQATLPTLLFMTPVGLLLLICCANVAGLILARSETRRREIAVRLAIGAGRARLVRQLFTESALLALAGAAVGLILAFWLFRIQPALMPPVGIEVGLDLRLNALVLAFTAVISLLAAIVFGLAPALRSTKHGVVSALKGNEAISGRSARDFLARNALVLGEIAISVVLLTASGLFVRSLLFSRNLEVGFDKQKNLIFFELAAGGNGKQKVTSLNSIQDRLAGLPGVARVSYAYRALLSDSGGGRTMRVSIPGVELPQGQPNIPIMVNAVGPEYFRTMGTGIVRGRSFSGQDSASSPNVAIVSETMARHFWPGQDAIDRHFSVEGKDCQIVGIAEDAKINGMHEEYQPYMYVPFVQWPSGDATVIIETVRDVGEVTPILRKEILSHDPAVMIVGVRTLHSLIQEALWADQIEAGSAIALSTLGMFLSALGLYGVIAYVVNRRRQEIGIRMAMGANPEDVMRMVLVQGLRTAAIGMVLGLMASLGTMRLLASLLYGVQPRDPISLFASSIVVMLVALAASYFPARRAAKVDPMVALRYQ